MQVERNDESGLKNMSSLSVRAYLDQTVVPLLLKGMVEVANQRCDNKTSQSDRVLGELPSRKQP